MHPGLDSLTSTGFTVDTPSHTIRFIRRFAAPRDQVFTAWTQPQHVTAWWDPTGEPLVRCEIDLRVGGNFIFVSGAHADMPFSGKYREISPPERLVFEAMGAEGRVILAAAEGGTLMTVEIACASPEHLEQFVNMGVAAGTSRTLDNLVSHLGSGPG